MLKDTRFPAKITINCQGRLLSLHEPVVMGILNLTPDSFYAGSRLLGSDGLQVDTLLERASEMLRDGAVILDLGAYSTRPGAADISEQEEIDRLVPAIETIRKAFPEAFLSADTFRAKVARAAVAAGANLINDVGGGTLDGEMYRTVAELQVPYILMHMRGTPADMQQHTHYDNLLADIAAFLLNQAQALHQMGVKDVIFDPGFGFAKTIDQNFELLRRLGELVGLGYPVLAGISRKSMIYRSLGTDAAGALNGTTFLHAFALSAGARILRVHDVKPAAEAIQLYSKLGFI
jgi:dihydropteroate synthase